MSEQEPLNLEQVDSENLANRKAVEHADAALNSAWDVFQGVTPHETTEESDGSDNVAKQVRAAGTDLADALRAAKKFNEDNYDSLHELASLEDSVRNETKKLADIDAQNTTIRSISDQAEQAVIDAGDTADRYVGQEYAEDYHEAVEDAASTDVSVKEFYEQHKDELHELAAQEDEIRKNPES